MKHIALMVLAATAVLVTAGMSIPVALASGAYSWVDASGVTHYSDQPPPASAKNPRRLRLSNSSSSSIETAPVDAPPGENHAMARAAGYEEQDIKRNCELATKNLDALNAAPEPPEGSDQATTREQSRAQAQGQVKLFCN